MVENYKEEGVFRRERNKNVLRERKGAMKIRQREEERREKKKNN